MLRTALLVQAVGLLLPAACTGSGVALLAGVVFGGTFLGIGSPVMGTGARMGIPRSAAVLTIAFGTGQIPGPAAAAPPAGLADTPLPGAPSRDRVPGRCPHPAHPLRRTRHRLMLSARPVRVIRGDRGRRWRRPDAER